MSVTRHLILASSSPYRADLLGRLGVPFETSAPRIDEAPLAGEAPARTAARLARLKAEAARARFRDAWIIGSDQVASNGRASIGKPGTIERAREQLAAMSGRTITFHTALCLLPPPPRTPHDALVPTEVTFRRLDAGEIDRYLAREPALDCAGSAKVEGLGIALLDELRGEDPTALIGLPLIALARMLRAEGFEVP